MIEQVVLDGGSVTIEAPAFPWQHVRRIGEDIVATELLFPRNHQLRPWDVGALLSGGIWDVPVWERVTVRIIPTGDEVLDFTTHPDPGKGQVVESNSQMLAALAREMENGIYTQLGEQGNNLSVGQKQLLALARVLVDTPQVLILDEATANIDSGTEQAIQQALARVREHTTLVVIAHRLSTIVEADTILVLHRGQAVERGSHQQLLTARGRYWQMYQLQLAGEELAASAQEESLIA